MGYLGVGATAREAVGQMQEGIDRRPFNCAWNDGRPIGAMGADGTLRAVVDGRIVEGYVLVPEGRGRGVTA